MTKNFFNKIKSKLPLFDNTQWYFKILDMLSWIAFYLIFTLNKYHELTLSQHIYYLLVSYLAVTFLKLSDKLADQFSAKINFCKRKN